MSEPLIPPQTKCCPTCKGTGANVRLTDEMKATMARNGFVDRGCPECDGEGFLPPEVSRCHAAESALAALQAAIKASMKGRLRYDDENVPNGVDFDADWSEDGRDMVAVVSLDALVPIEEGDAVTEYDRGYKDGYDKGRAEYAALQAHFRDCGECLDCLKESGLGALVPIQEEPR